MTISEIIIKNFKSFGNSEQKLKLNTEQGELVLLSGDNGNGKSSLISSIDFGLFGKCKGNKRKWATMKTLPNRINSGDLLVDIKFKSGKTDVEVKRGISPNILKLYENGIEDTKAGKSNINKKIEDYVGMDIETFKSFISMSINDFKNFISLTNEEKKILLDRLFNLEVINILGDILKDINRNNKNSLSNIDAELSTLDDSIKSIKTSIENSIKRQKIDTENEIKELKDAMLSKKDNYLKLKEKLDKISDKEAELKDDIKKETEQLSTVKNDIRNTDKEINLFNKDKCPTCSTSFNSSHFFDLKDDLNSKKEKYSEIKEEIENNINQLNKRKIKLIKIKEETTESFNEINYSLRNYKERIKKLNEKSKKKTGKEAINISEFEKTLNELKNKKKESAKKSSIKKEKAMYYKELNKIFGEDGVKKSIISGIIKPINHFIKENISKMGLNFSVELDKTFTAKIKALGSEIDHDSLSTGETKKINIAILISYLMLIRTKKYINVLFLDEVFSSIDLSGIDSILNLLKSFASEYKINIFVVHHAILSENMFDKIIKIKKDVFTSIEEHDISKVN